MDPTDKGQKNIEELDLGHWLFTQDCKFVTSVTNMGDLPNSKEVEIAFAGRSNVGKSSLINALTNRKNLARTSSKPGRTQQVNFFNLGEKLMITDLPGYGYARAPRATVQEWTNLVGDYLQGRAQLRRVCLLVDGRHGFKDNDREIMNLLDQSAVYYQVVLTKCDKLKQNHLVKLIKLIKNELITHIAAYPELSITSSTKGLGVKTLRAELAALSTGR